MRRPDDHQLPLDFGDADGGDDGAATPAPPPDETDRVRIRTDLDATLFVEAGAGAGKTTALVARILSLVDAGTPIGAIAAITFTEKAAADLRHRVRTSLTEAAERDAAAAAGGSRWTAALDDLDHAPIGTLHAFARRILLEFPVEAGLPPGFGVLDELESRLVLDERWEDLQDELLDDAAKEVAPGLPAWEFVQLCAWSKFGGMPAVRRIVEDFQANWDLVAERVVAEPPARPTLELDELVAEARMVAATHAPPGDKQAERLAGLDEATAALQGASGSRWGIGHVLVALDEIVRLTGSPDRVGNKVNWRLHGGDAALDDLRRAEKALAATAAACLAPWREYRRLVLGSIAARFVLAGAEERATAGSLEFHDLLVLARRLLTREPGARRLLHERYQRLLLDEFQDTDPIQLEIAVRLAAAPADQSPDVTALRPLPGRLFVVGDPKQSIYRFRRADIAAYLRAGPQLAADRATLSANFRSTTAVIDWVNGVFAEVIQADDDVQPAYGPLDTCRPAPRHHGTVRVLGTTVHVDVDADEMRWREAESVEVAAAVVTALEEGWLVGDDGALRPCRPGDIAILLPARTSLPMLEAALRERVIPYRAENAAVVYVAAEIRHLMLALKAAADPTDELALVAALRTPLYGCSDVELFDWREARGRWSIHRPPPAGFEDHPVARALAHVRSMADRVGRDGPAELLDRIVVERRMLETALGGLDARDVWRRVRYVVDQARAWTDAGGRGLRRYLAWAAYQAGEGRASDTILPERDHDAVRIMTVHAAKGLEFPITIVAGMTTQVQRRSATSVAWFDSTWTLREKGDELFESFRPLDEQMGDAERRRLLYVACTRAVDHLVVSLHRKREKTDDGTAGCTSVTVLAVAGGAGHGGRGLTPSGSALVHPPAAPLELPWADAAAWAAERERAVAAAARRTTLSATRLAAAAPPSAPAPPLDAPLDPGLAKDPVDLDLPPWQRGRYGTAIGRAVHGVLQDADLVDGGDIEVLAGAQCAAEGIFDLQDLVARLSRSALVAPIVRAAAGGAEHWRELYVVAPVGAIVLEGYVDLLVRTPAGLVIVDYKTDRFGSPADRVERLGRYRLQLAVYGVALGRLLDEPIVGGVLVHCVPDGPAGSHDVDRWPEALAEIDVLAASA